jgi:hypothetical protein
MENSTAMVVPATRTDRQISSDTLRHSASFAFINLRTANDISAWIEP